MLFSGYHVLTPDPNLAPSSTMVFGKERITDIGEWHIPSPKPRCILLGLMDIKIWGFVDSAGPLHKKYKICLQLYRRNTISGSEIQIESNIYSHIITQRPTPYNMSVNLTSNIHMGRSDIFVIKLSAIKLPGVFRMFNSNVGLCVGGGNTGSYINMPRVIATGVNVDIVGGGVRLFT